MRVSQGMKTNYAFWSLILLFLYYDIDRWIPLGNWNGEHHWPVQNVQSSLDILVGVVLLVAILSFRANFRPGMVLGVALLTVWVYFHVREWWVPYFHGVTSPRSIAFHASLLEHTQVLPRFGNHFPPDAEHTFIDFFLFPAFFFSFVATVRSLDSRPKS
jgi:hypothetical protein